MTQVETHGFVEQGFERVEAILSANLASGADLGASVCATRDGETIIDLWGGFADQARTRLWEKDTIVNVWSTTKTMTALCALILADRGQLDVSAPVARYWPEFAAEGKEAVTVAQLLSHSSGLAGWREPMAPETLYDWDEACARLARQAPYWEPGTAPGYHAITQGNLVGEVVRRIDGRSLGTFFREEVAEPLGEDFHIGLPPSEDHRVAELVPPPPLVGEGAAGEPSPLLVSIMTNPPLDPLATRTRAWRAAEIPAAGGHGNARSVAQIHVALANEGVAKGRRLLSAAGARRALEPQIEGTDLVIGAPVRFGLGFGLPGGFMATPHPNTAFWGGWGGSLIFIDYDARTTFAYVMNRMEAGVVGDARGLSLVQAFWEAAG